MEKKFGLNNHVLVPLVGVEVRYGLCMFLVAVGLVLCFFKEVFGNADAPRFPLVPFLGKH